MKRILTYICVVAIALVAVSCKKKVKVQNVNIEGSWELADIETKSAQLAGQTVAVYLDFTAADFTVYQMIGEGRFRRFTGTYTVTGDVLDGQYADGSRLGASYKVSVDGDILKLDSAGETDTYRRCTIPADVLAVQ